MSLMNAVSNLAVHTVTIEPYLGNNASGYDTPTYGAAKTYKSRVTTKNVLVTNAMGRQVESKGVIYLNTSSVPTLKDRVTLPSYFVPSQPVIIAVRPRFNDKALDHVEVWF